MRGLHVHVHVHACGSPFTAHTSACTTRTLTLSPPPNPSLNARTKHSITCQHNTTRQSDNLAQLPGSRPLPRADYLNETKALRRALKQVGRGSLTAGIAAARDVESPAAVELAALLGVAPGQVASEARAVPDSDLDIDTLYRSLLSGGGAGAGAAAGESAGGAGAGEGGAAGGGGASGGGAEGAGAVSAAEYDEIFRWVGPTGRRAPVVPALLPAFLSRTAPSTTHTQSNTRNQTYAIKHTQLPPRPPNHHHHHHLHPRRKYDADGSGALEPPELQAVLADLGLLDGKTAREAAAAAEHHMRAADRDGAGALGPEAFRRWCATLVMNKARQALRFKMGVQVEGELTAGENDAPCGRLGLRATLGLAVLSSCHPPHYTHAIPSMTRTHTLKKKQTEDLRATFIDFASYGAREEAAAMDGKALMKLARDARLLSARLSPTDVDLIFAKVKAKGARRVDFDQFVSALSLFAQKKGASLERVVGQILDAGGPKTRATKADSVRLHDDRSTYTGVYKRGGPTNVDDVFSLATLVDRSCRPGGATPGSAGGRRPRASIGSAGARSPAVTVGGTPAAAPASASASRRASSGAGALTPPAAGGSRVASSAGGDAVAQTLEDVFASFARFGIGSAGGATPPAAAGAGSASKSRKPAFDTLTRTPTNAARGPATPDGAVLMDGFRFAKLCREAGLVDGKALTATAVDLIFTKVKPRGAKKIGFDEFAHALGLLAQAKGAPAADVAAAVERCGGPAVGGATTPGAVRFYDDVAGRRASVGAGGDDQ